MRLTSSSLRTAGRARRTSAVGSVAALAAVTAAVGSGCAAPTAAAHQGRTGATVPVTAPSASPAPAAVGTLGTYRVGQRRITFTEPAHAGSGGTYLPARHLVTLVRYPLASASPSAAPAKGPLPMIVFGPGFMSCPAPYSDLLDSWASAGYVVAAVNFPRSSCKVGAAATETDLVHQPADLSYVITAMLTLSRAPHSPFAGMVNPSEVAIAGHSDGGDTVAAIAGNTCCADRRVRAVAVLSGAEWPAMHGSYFTRTTAPMLFVQGSADTVNWPGCSVDMYLADPAQARYYLDVAGVDHTTPYWGTSKYEQAVAQVSTAFFDRWVLGQRSADAAMLRDGTVPGLAALYRYGRGPLAAGPCDNLPPPGSG